LLTGIVDLCFVRFRVGSLRSLDLGPLDQGKSRSRLNDTAYFPTAHGRPRCTDLGARSHLCSDTGTWKMEAFWLNRARRSSSRPEIQADPPLEPFSATGQRTRWEANYRSTKARTTITAPAAPIDHMNIFRRRSDRRISVSSLKHGEQRTTCSWAGSNIEMLFVAMASRTAVPGQPFLSGLGYCVRATSFNARINARSSRLDTLSRIRSSLTVLVAKEFLRRFLKSTSEPDGYGI
jgi:hypothetical protein